VCVQKVLQNVLFKILFYKINFLNSHIQTQLYTLKAYLSHTTKTKHGVMCVKILLHVYDLILLQSLQSTDTNTLSCKCTI